MSNREQFYKEFYIALEKTVKPSGGELSEVEVPKNNRILKGIAVKFEDTVLAPTIYPDGYFPDWQSGKPMDNIVSSIKSEIIRTAPTLSKFNTDCMNRESANTHLRAATVNYDSNKEWLKNIPHERLADLAVFMKWEFDKNSSDVVTSAQVTEPFLARLQLTKEEALKIAKTNLAKGYKFDSMDHVILGYMQESGMDDGLIADLKSDAVHPLYVLTSKDEWNGAALIANSAVLHKVREELDDDFYVLPSSIHEVLIVPKSESLPVDELKDMVYSVNRQDIPVEDRLSDNVYEYDGHSLKIAGAELTQEHNIAESITHHRSR